MLGFDEGSTFAALCEQGLPAKLQLRRVGWLASSQAGHRADLRALGRSLLFLNHPQDEARAVLEILIDAENSNPITDCEE